MADIVAPVQAAEPAADPALAMPPIPDGHVPVFNSDGELVSIPRDQLQGAKNDYGYSDAQPEDIQAYMRHQVYGSGLSQLKTAAEGAAEGVAGPVAPYLETKLGISTPEAIKGRREENPWTHGIANAAGMIGSTVTGVGEGALLSKAGEAASGLTKAGKAAEELSTASKLGEGVEKAHEAYNALPMTSKLGTAALQGAVETGLYGVGDSATEAVLGDPDALGEKLLPTMGLNMVAGGVGGAALKGLGMGVGKLAEYAKGDGEMGPKSFLKKAVSTVFGVSPENASKYMAEREAVNSVPEFETMADHLLGHIQKIDTAAESAGAEYKAAAQAMKDELIDKGYDTKIAHSASQAALRQAQDNLATETLNGAMDASKAVADSVGKLRDHVYEQSAKAYDILEGSGQHIDLGGFKAKANELIQDLKTKGTIESNQAAEKLSSYLALHPGDSVPAPMAKKMIQGLDVVSKFDRNATPAANDLGRQYAQIRHTLDTELKAQVPHYAEAMKPLAQDSQLLNNLRKYEDPASAMGKIKGLNNQGKYATDMTMLKQLEARVGTEFTPAIDKYANPAVRKVLEEQLPHAAEARAAAEAAEAFKNPETKRIMHANLEAQLQKLPEYARFREAQEAQQALKGLSEKNYQGVMNKVLRGKDLEARKLLESVPELQGKSLAHQLELLKVKQAFEKGAGNGSRNETFMGGLLGMISHASHHNPITGVLSGAISGGIIDRFGPAIGKKILDTVIDNQAKIASFKAMQEAASGVTRKIITGAGNIFKATPHTAVIPAAKFDYDKVSKWVKDFQATPEHAMNTLNKNTQDIARHAPNVAGAVQAKTAAGAAFLKSKLPPTPEPSPFSPKMKPSSTDVAQFKRYYETVQNPISVMNRVKDGTVTINDVEALSKVYPKMYEEMKNQVMNSLLDNVQKGKEVPYKTRIGVSLFMGSPLDNSMQPQNIIAAQPKPTAPQPQQGGGGGGKLNASAANKLGKMSESYQTPSQSAEAGHSKK